MARKEKDVAAGAGGRGVGADSGTGGAENPNVMAGQYQMLQQQLQNVLIQKESMHLNSMEIDRALEEIEKSGEGRAYKITGPIMISKPKDVIKKELQETKEAIGVRIESLEKTEKRIVDRLKELEGKLREILKQRETS